jgi:acetyl-CoA carboxylase biotin carboxyl carrier protein
MEAKTDAEARRTIARLAGETLPRLIERLARSELGELEVRDDGWRIRLRRASGVEDEAQAASSRAGAAAAGDKGERAHTVRHPATARRAEPPRGLIASPAVGYYIPREGVTVGTSLRSGDVIGHVDVLGVRHEVVAPVDGVVATLEVESGQAIEYGQPIARVDQVAGRDLEPAIDAPQAGPPDAAQPPVEQLVEA